MQAAELSWVLLKGISETIANDVIVKMNLYSAEYDKYNFDETKSHLYVDIFWEHGEENFKMFANDLNKTQPTVKFTAEWSSSTINFLNVAVSIKREVIQTDLYAKPKDSHK